MRCGILRAAVVAATCAAALPAQDASDRTAAKMPAKPVAHMVIEKRFLCKEGFADALPDAIWNAKQYGTWTLVDGRLDGAEREKDHHTAVAYLNVGSLPACCVIRFRFRLGEAREAAIMGQAGSGDQQHPTFMLAVDHGGFGLVAMPDRTATPPEPVPTCFPRVSAAIDGAAWHLMTLEIAGDEALAYLDDQHVGYARHPAFLKARWGISLRATGADQPVSFDDVWLSAGALDPRWNQARQDFVDLADKAARQ